MREFYPLLVVGGVIGLVSLVLLIAFLSIKDMFDNLMLTVKNATNERKAKTKQMTSVSATRREYPEAFNVAINMLNKNTLLSD